MIAKMFGGFRNAATDIEVYLRRHDVIKPKTSTPNSFRDDELDVDFGWQPKTGSKLSTGFSRNRVFQATIAARNGASLQPSQKIATRFLRRISGRST